MSDVDRTSRGGTGVAGRVFAMRGLGQQGFFSDAPRLHIIMLLGGIVLNGTLIALHAAAGLATWRLVTMFVTFVIFATCQQLVLSRARRTGDFTRGFIAMGFLAQTFLGAQMSVTGGLHSALLPALPLMAIQTTLLFGPHRISASVATALLAIVAVLAILPADFTGPPVTGWPYLVAVILMFVWILTLVRAFLGRMLTAHEEATQKVEALRETQLASAEAQSRRLQSVGAKVAHELNNPLTSIKGLIQLQARGATDDKAKQRFDVVQSEIARMEVILREYLSFSRPLEDLEAVPVELGALVADAVAVIMGRAEHGRIAVQVGGTSAHVVADPRRLKEAVLNVLSNAVDHTPAGGMIRVTTQAAADGGATITIADDGRGISPADLAKLGTSYFTTRAAGTGLGIVLVLGVVAQHGGRVHYASEPGRGTTVTVHLRGKPEPVASGAEVLTTSTLHERAAS